MATVPNSLSPGTSPLMHNSHLHPGHSLSPSLHQSSQSTDPLDWKYIQSFGDDMASDDDLVTAVRFDSSGDYLAVGDKAGRICIFEGHASKAGINMGALNTGKGGVRPPQPLLQYKFYTEFQSHDREFDSLKSQDIEEKINMIQWGKRLSTGMFLLATNDKTIKFWKVHDKKLKRVRPANSINQSLTPAIHKISPTEELIIPRLQHSQTITTATPKRVYANAHDYHINSISLNSDGETFLSADDLRINQWHFDVSGECFTLVDLKPSNIQELSEVITSAAFHPTNCSQLLYSSSKGSIRLADLRDSALCDTAAKVFEIDSTAQRSFFSEITSSISDAIFAGPDGRYIISRDYLTIKVWDVAQESRPLYVIPVHDYLRVHLKDLYDNDCIFDKFNVAASSDGQRLITGSYNNHFMVHSLRHDSSTTFEAARGRVITPNVTEMDFGKKALHTQWHPNANTLAVAGLNKIYIYQALQAELEPF